MVLYEALVLSGMAEIKNTFRLEIDSLTLDRGQNVPETIAAPRLRRPTRLGHSQGRAFGESIGTFGRGAHFFAPLSLCMTFMTRSYKQRTRKAYSSCATRDSTGSSESLLIVGPLVWYGSGTWADGGRDRK